MLNRNSRKPCVVANWKMQGTHGFVLEFMDALLKSSSNLGAIEVILCPPFVYLNEVRKIIDNCKDASAIFKLGAQNFYSNLPGAYTGEVSASMLVDTGCQYVILGHSERRQLMGETDGMIAEKCLMAYDMGLIPIVCVGETKGEREGGRTYEVVKKQVESILDFTALAMFTKALIAYEPVWAIGSGLTASPAQAQDVHAFIRELISKHDRALADNLRILYGGSVKPSNAASLFKEPDIDGGLIGNASLDVKAFLNICESAVERTEWNKSF